MYIKTEVDRLISFLRSQDGIADKDKLKKEVQQYLGLVRDRSVYCSKFYSIRFCKAESRVFSNGVLALSVLQKYDQKPFFVCIVTKETNHIIIANSTFLKKISHSSLDLRIDNIRGTFLGSDIMSEPEGIPNEIGNFEYLYSLHENFTFEENLERLVSNTNNIHPTKIKFEPNSEELTIINQAAERAIKFMQSSDCTVLEGDLFERVTKVKDEILIAAFIENVNLRGRIIEFLITDSGDLSQVLADALHEKKALPSIFTSDDLGDYSKIFDDFTTATDIKTKVLFLSSNPKGYNIDKLLSFLAKEKSVYLIFIVAIDENRRIHTKLCSMFNTQLLESTRLMRQWAGRNSRGVTQYDGKALETIVFRFNSLIDKVESEKFIKTLIEL